MGIAHVADGASRRRSLLPWCSAGQSADLLARGTCLLAQIVQAAASRLYFADRCSFHDPASILRLMQHCVHPLGSLALSFCNRWAAHREERWLPRDAGGRAEEMANDPAWLCDAQ